jgi:hypothetical protein
MEGHLINYRQQKFTILADNAPLNDLKKNTFLVVTARNTSFEMG